MTGEADAAIVRGQNGSVISARNMLRMLLLSRCNQLAKLLTSMPSSRIFLFRKLVTIGAAMASKVHAFPDVRPLWLPNALAIVVSEEPKSSNKMRLPAAISGEAVLERPSTRCDHKASPKLPGRRSRTLRNAPGSCDLAAILSQIVAVDNSRARETDDSDSPR